MRLILLFVVASHVHFHYCLKITFLNRQYRSREQGRGFRVGEWCRAACVRIKAMPWKFSDGLWIKKGLEDPYKTSSYFLINGYSISIVMISFISILLYESVTTQEKVLIKTYLIKLKSTVIRNEDWGNGKKPPASGLTLCKNQKKFEMWGSPQVCNITAKILSKNSF